MGNFEKSFNSEPRVKTIPNFPLLMVNDTTITRGYTKPKLFEWPTLDLGPYVKKSNNMTCFNCLEKPVEHPVKWKKSRMCLDHVCQILLELSEDLIFWKVCNYKRINLCWHINAVLKFRSARREIKKFLDQRTQGNSDNEAFSIDKPIHAGISHIPSKKTSVSFPEIQRRENYERDTGEEQIACVTTLDFVLLIKSKVNADTFVNFMIREVSNPDTLSVTLSWTPM